MSFVFCLSTNRFRFQENIKDYKITGKTYIKDGVRCAILKKDGDNNIYIKPWSQVSFVRKPGEANAQHKLTDKIVTEIIIKYFDVPKEKINISNIAKEYNVSSTTMAAVLHGTSWKHISRPLLNKLRGIETSSNEEQVSVCVKADNKTKNKSAKVSEGLSKFIVRDYYVNGVPLKSLAKKFLISESATRRIITGKSWKSVTVPAIEEFSKWKR